MKRSIFLVLSLLISITVLISCGSDSNSDQEELPGEVIPQLTTSKSIASMDETIVKVAGEGNDLLTITIPKLPFGQSEDIVVEFKLIYNGTDPLPEISIDTDIEFDAAVTLEFRSDSLTEKSYVFVYHGAAQDYFVPFEKNGNIYTAKLLHFSQYGFDETPGPSSLMADIKAGLIELNSYTGDGGLYALNRALIIDIFAKINLLEQIEPALEHNFRTDFIVIIDRVVDTWLTKMERSIVPFWDGYCVHSDLKDFLTQLVRTMTEVELNGADDITARVQRLLSSHMKAAAVEWQEITPPEPCDTNGLEEYTNCGFKFATEMELSGVDPTVDIIKIIVELIDSNNLFILENADCDNIDCLRYYLSKQDKMVLSGLEDRTQALQAKLTEIEEQVDNGSCGIVGTWKGCGGQGCYTVTFNSEMTVHQLVVSTSGHSINMNGKWKLAEHPSGGDGVELYNMEIEGYGGNDSYMFKIEENGTLSNAPATPSVILTKQ